MRQLESPQISWSPLSGATIAPCADGARWPRLAPVTLLDLCREVQLICGARRSPCQLNHGNTRNGNSSLQSAITPCVPTLLGRNACFGKRFGQVALELHFVGRCLSVAGTLRTSWLRKFASLWKWTVVRINSATPLTPGGTGICGGWATASCGWMRRLFCGSCRWR